MTRRRGASGLLPSSMVAVLLVAGGVVHARPRVPPAAMAKIVAGGVVTYSLPPPPGSRVRIGKAIGIVEGSPEAVVHTLLDADSYPDFAYRVKGARRLKRHADGIDARIETNLPWPLSDAWADVKITYRHLGGHVYRVRWHMLRGTLKAYRGSALIEPWDDRLDKCTLTYTLLAVPKTIIPNAALSRGTRRGAEMVLHRVRIRVKHKTRERKFPPGLAKRYQ